MLGPSWLDVDLEQPETPDVKPEMLPSLWTSETRAVFFSIGCRVDRC